MFSTSCGYAWAQITCSEHTDHGSDTDITRIVKLDMIDTGCAHGAAFLWETMLETTICPMFNCTTEREAKYDNIKEQNTFFISDMFGI